MQFSKRVSELARLHGVDPKDVLFALLQTSGASVAEAFAVIYRPAVSTTAALQTRASNYIGQRPGLKKLIKYLDDLKAAPRGDSDRLPTPTKRRGRPRKDNGDGLLVDKPILDYTDKDAVLKEYADIAVSAEKIGDKLSALNGIATLQRMKQEAAIEDEKKDNFYIPLTHDRCDELLEYLRRYYAEKEGSNTETAG